MNTRKDQLDEAALQEHYAKASAPVSVGSNADEVAKPLVNKSITPDGLRLGSKAQVLRDGKVRGESKAARRMRRRAVVG